MKRLFGKPHKLKMFTKLLVSYTVLVLIPLIVLGTVSYRQTNAYLRKNAQTDFENLFASVRSEISNRFFRVESTLNIISDDNNVLEVVNATFLSPYQKAQAVSQRLDPILLTVCTQNDYIRVIRVYTYGDIKGLRDYFIDAEKIQTTYEKNRLFCSGNPLWLYDEGGLSVSRKSSNLAAPRRSATITAELNAEKLFAACIPQQSLDYRIRLLAADGSVICSWEKHDGKPFDEDGETMLKKAASVGNAGWSLEMETDSSAMMLGVFSGYSSTLYSIVASLALLLPIIFGLSYSFSKRVKKLKAQLDSVVPSNYTAEISSEDSDEIGDITNAVGAMVKNTRSAILQVYEEKLARRDAKIQALQAQINPHFLYNTLSNLNWQAIAKGDMESSRLLTALSKFYRLSLNNGHSVSTVGQELEHVKIYVEIQCAIHRCPTLDVSYEAQEEVLDYNMPGIILQPIVENALEHGIATVGYENGKLSVTVRREDDNIVIRISDNGPGIDPDLVKRIFDENGDVGYGIKNVYQRLRLFFEDKCTLSFEETPGGGSTVVISIPPCIQK